MRLFLTPFVLISLLIKVVAAPTLTTNYRFSPGSETRIVFDNAMVAKEKVGSHQDNDILTISPAWKGRIFWQAENIALFQALETPPLDTTFSFATKAGLSDLKGNKIKPTELGKKSTSRFTITRSKQLGTASNDEKPALFLSFQDDVSATDLAPYFFYQNKEGNRSAALVTQAKYGDIKSTYYTTPSWTSRYQFAINKTLGKPQQGTKLADNTVLSNCVVVRPIETLPPGKRWTLYCIKGIPNLTKTAKLFRSGQFGIGDKLHFHCLKSTAITYPNEARFLRLRFNSKVLKTIPKEQLAAFIQITPAIPNMSFKVKKDHIDVHGDFYKTNSYRVSIQRSLRAQNGLSLASTFSQQITFKHIKPSMAIPSFSSAQLAKGQRKYPIETVNMASVRVRVKSLTREQAVRAYQGFNQFLANQKGYKNQAEAKRVTLPVSLINGTTVHDQVYSLDNKLDTSRTLVLDWDKVLPKDRKNLIFFIDVAGTPKANTNASVHHVQSFIQLTDIGLAWKQNTDGTFLYCYSCDTGRPLANVNIQTYSDDATILKTYQTDSNGTVNLPHAAKFTHLSATVGGDSYIIPWRRNMSSVRLWRFPVQYDYYKFAGWKREALIFTDRKLYKPSEKVRIKGIVRERKDNQHRIPLQRKASLSIFDPADRILLEKKITLSENGSFDQSLDLPSSNLGTYQIRLNFEITKDQRRDEEVDDNAWEHNWHLERNSQFTSYFSVQEFRRNAFKVKSKITPVETKNNSITASVNANYYMGTAVAKGKLEWFLSVSNSGFYPEKFREYYFGNHLNYDPYYWDYYYGYNDGERYKKPGSQKQNGTFELTEAGTASFDLNVEPPKFPTPQKVKLISEVTDGREQTLTSISNITLHPSSHYIGISRIDSLLRNGNINELKFIAVDKSGNLSKVDLDATVTINRITYDPVKVRSGDGSITINNNQKEELYSKTNIKLVAGNPTSLHFLPQAAGRYTVTIDSKDPEGNRISSATRIRVYGSKEYPWAVNTGMKIELAPEKKRYQPGDTARILVKTPIEGTALVTVERSGVKRHYLRQLKTSDPIIELPIEHLDAPNVYVSVLLIRGSSASPLKYKEPALRLGYCNLTVENQIDKIDVTLDTPLSSYRPGATITLSGTLTDYKNKPVSNAEITFYGEDNGVLDVIGYRMPKPLTFFNKKISLAVETGTSLDTFLQEMAAEDMDMINQSILNKGYTIGGGGEAIDQIKKKIRKNFDPCAFWNPKLKTDANGRFSFTFIAPETLTSYKVMAVATAGSQKFGSANSEIVINKPLMLEPMAPRFANEGDTTRTKLYIANNSKYEGTWKVELQTNSLSEIVGDITKIHPQHAARTINLKPGGSAYLDYDVKHLSTGNATWTWSAEPVTILNHKLTPKLRSHLSDGIENKFKVLYPRPILKGARFRKLTKNQQDVLQGIDPSLFNGRGRIELNFSNNLLFKAQGAADHLLNYPYG